MARNEMEQNGTEQNAERNGTTTATKNGHKRNEHSRRIIMKLTVNNSTDIQ